tara:strand:+ start:727 stop:969 length:243 start_codon:yes stop_codon:yes gene_type:complete
MEVKIWGIIEGPTAAEDFPDSYDAPEGAAYYMVCTVEIGGKLEEDNFWFEDFNDAYEWVKYFNNTAEPLLLDTGSGPVYN